LEIGPTIWPVSLTQLLRERRCIRFSLRREDDGLADVDQMPRQRSTDVADSDDCGRHGDSSLLLDPCPGRF
jgi:hypothetical protein